MDVGEVKTALRFPKRSDFAQMLFAASLILSFARVSVAVRSAIASQTTSRASRCRPILKRSTTATRHRSRRRHSRTSTSRWDAVSVRSAQHNQRTQFRCCHKRCRQRRSIRNYGIRPFCISEDEGAPFGSRSVKQRGLLIYSLFLERQLFILNKCAIRWLLYCTRAITQPDFASFFGFERL